jgi:hypothetical protein
MSPFSRDLLNHTEAELDFILEMYAADHPEKFKFTRPGEEQRSKAEVRAAWDRVLTGAAQSHALPKMPLAKLKKYSETLGTALSQVQQNEANNA